MFVRKLGALVACAAVIAGSAAAQAAPRVETSAPYQALLHAIVNTNPAGARKLLEQGLDPNARVRPLPEDAWIVTPDRPTDQPLLVVASRFGVPESPIVAMLLERSANPDIRDAKERTPLMYAAELGWNPSVDLLLARKVDVNAADVDGVTVLMHAMGARNLETLATLVKHGARVNTADKAGRTPLMHAIARVRYDPVRLYDEKDRPVEDIARYLQVVRLLVEHKADVNARDKNGDTPLKLARAQRVAGLVELLAAAGARD